MLIPQFTIRWLLLLTATCGLFFLALSYAAQGSHWALGISVGVASMLFVLAFHVLVFMAAWLYSFLHLARRDRPVAGINPFATAASPAAAAVVPPPDAKPSQQA